MNLERILVFRAGHLGDNLVALPALWALRDAFPNAHLTYLSNADDKNNPHYVTARGIFPEKGLFDSWISYPNLDGIVGKYRGLRLGLQLRRLKFDALLYMTTRTRTIGQIERDVRFFGLAGIKKIIGAEYMKEHRLIGPVKGPMHEIEREGDFLVELLRGAGLIDNQRMFGPDLRLTAAERAAAEKWLGPDSESKLVGVGPGSKWESKVWYEDRFAEVVDRLIKRHRVVPVIFGGGEDREKGRRLIERWGTGINAAGELNIRHAAAALEKCELYLGNDTGTMHLAASVGTRCVAIFSALDLIGRWYPFGSENEIFRRSVECEGCYSPTCFNKNKCLDLIGVDEVYQACVRVLDKRARKVTVN